MWKIAVNGFSNMGKKALKTRIETILSRAATRQVCYGGDSHLSCIKNDLYLLHLPNARELPLSTIIIQNDIGATALEQENAA